VWGESRFAMSILVGRSIRRDGKDILGSRCVKSVFRNMYCKKNKKWKQVQKSKTSANSPITFLSITHQP
jgi:hypothetical protein